MRQDQEPSVADIIGDEGLFSSRDPVGCLPAGRAERFVKKDVVVDAK